MYVGEMFADLNNWDHLDEVAMNPTAYAQSVETGADRNVKVGFEFEVCIPAQSVKNYYKNLHSEIPLALQLLKKMGNSWDDDMSLEKFEFGYDSFSLSYYFKLKESVIYNDVTYNKLDKLISAYMEPYYQKMIKVTMEKLSQRHVAKIKRTLAQQRTYQLFFKKLLNYIDSELSRDRAWAALQPSREIYGRATNFTTFAKKVFGARNKNDLLVLLTPNIPHIQEYVENIGYDTDDDYGGDYSRAANMIQAEIKQRFGQSAEIFQSYHSRRKRTDRWYIEPDGSLDPRRNDTSAEVVSPPLPVKQAIDALQTFYNMSKEHKFYTGAEYHTGLHINVSIPGKLDILKLALFLGDQYILQLFKRENNEYVESIMKSIIERMNEDNESAEEANELVRMMTKKTGLKSVLNELGRMAKDISDDHNASISYNGKWVSFRHAGGDYLNNYTDVYNVLGRFVRAMVIASDSTAYKQEYIQKLLKLVPRYEEPNKSLMSITQYRTTPIPIVIRGFYPTGSPRASYNTLRNEVSSISRAPALVTKDVSLANKLITANSRDISPDHKTKLRSVNSLATLEIYINPTPELVRIYQSFVYRTYKYSAYSSRLTGYVLGTSMTVAPGTPLHKLLLSKLMTQYKNYLRGQRNVRH